MDAEFAHSAYGVLSASPGQVALYVEMQERSKGVSVSDARVCALRIPKRLVYCDLCSPNLYASAAKMPRAFSI